MHKLNKSKSRKYLFTIRFNLKIILSIAFVFQLNKKINKYYRKSIIQNYNIEAKDHNFPNKKN